MKKMWLALTALMVAQVGLAGERVSASEFRVRDPFVVPCAEDRLYHLFISDEWSGGVGVSVRTSPDLKTWSAPKKVLTVPESWQIIDTWAPEVHRFRDKWYIFVTLSRLRPELEPMKLMTTDPDFIRRYGSESFAKRRRLGTYVFRSDNLDGPYEAVAADSLTPVDRMALDGTFWEEDGQPYMVFSWDWPQLGIGECAYAPLMPDLSGFAAKPQTLFRASEIATNAWKANVDGPYLHRSEKSGKLFAIWSTTGLGSDFERGRPIFEGMKDGAYSVILCESASGRIAGPWVNQRVIYSQNGGHGMFFKTFDGRLLLAIHQPEKWFDERTAFFSVEDRGDELAITGRFEPGFPKSAFVTPPSDHSPGYFWLWNARLEPAVIRSQLVEMASNGVRSVCIHPFPKGFRPGRFHSDMTPDYLTAGYMEAYRTAVDQAAELGMNAWLYDEGGWPSGGACGQVAKADREGKFRQRYLELSESGSGTAVVARDYVANIPNVPSLVEPGTTAKFLNLTHDRYARVLGGHVGKTVRYAFTDEPDCPIRSGNGGLGWSSDFAEQFRRRKGYDILPFARELLERGNGTLDERLTRVRIDYHEVMGDLFVERFLTPVREWCHAHGMLSSGHLNGEDVPEYSNQYGHGPLLKSLRTLDVPGVDVIWRQLYPTSYVHPGHQAPFPRYAASAAHQNGGRQVMSESFGIYGNSLTPDEMKWLVDFQLVRGVNMFVFGYYAMAYAGQWMALMEPVSGPCTPYWEFQKPFFDYVARMSSMLASGTPTTEIAVLYDERGFRAGGLHAEMAGDRLQAVSRTLDRMNCEYEFVDEEQLAAAKLENGLLVVGAMRYSTVVLPTAKWMREAARCKLDEFRAAGGQVLGADELAAIRPTLDIAGGLRKELRVAKRRCGDETLYFVVNESQWDGKAELRFAEAGEVVHCDPETGRYVATDVRNGRLEWEFPRFGSAMFIVGATADGAASAIAGSHTNELACGWTLRKSVSHVAGCDRLETVSLSESAVPSELGDWRSFCGDRFSGKVVYRHAFVSARGGAAMLDLGKVCWACGVRLNGQDVGKKFFGPYRLGLQLAPGTNVLEVTVANTLANQLGDVSVRDRIARDFPPRSGYDLRQRAFDLDHHESGLFGPVRLITDSEVRPVVAPEMCDIRSSGERSEGPPLSLKDVFAPVIVGVPPTYAARDLCQLADGEIRHYGREIPGSEPRRVYLSSRDGGLNWQTKVAAAKDPGALVRSPWSGDWIGFSGLDPVMLVRSGVGPGDVSASRTAMPWKRLELRQLTPLKSRKRWLASFSNVLCANQECYHAATAYSDDDGRTWTRTDLKPVAGVERLSPGDCRPHWFNDGCEPTFAELTDGTILLCVRTSGPHAAFYRSTDGGATWGDGKANPAFWQSNTMPYFFRLKDGRLLFFWNNTASLPTRPIEEYPELSPGERKGIWETAFTNRDALHAAISDDDGLTWRGFREVALNEIRNAADFRQLGWGPFEENDKSIHQTQALELEGGKVLLAYGQGRAARRMLVFDPDWLLETSRTEEFRSGLGGISNHLYVRSLSGSNRGWSGHCAWNRVPGALLVRDPETDSPLPGQPRSNREVLQLCRIRDSRLVSDRQGVVWNFPAARKGRLELVCRIVGEGFRLTLADHWMNPCDETGPLRCPLSEAIDLPDLRTEGWHRLIATWTEDAVRLTIDGREALVREKVKMPVFGLSYLHLQTLAEATDEKGTIFRSFHFQGTR